MKYIITIFISIYFMTFLLTGCCKHKTTSTINESFIVAQSDDGTSEEFKLVDEQEVDESVRQQDKPKNVYHIHYVSVIL